MTRSTNADLSSWLHNPPSPAGPMIYIVFPRFPLASA